MNNPSFERILVTGGGGMLAGDAIAQSRVAWPRAQVYSPGRAHLDVTDRASIERAFSEFKPQLVWNCAAYTNVDKAESERDLAHAVNTVAPALLTEACRRGGAKLIHFSTDQVFDGASGKPCGEDEPAHPANHYAATKLAGEAPVLSEPGNIVLRVQWLYGERKDRFSVLRTREEFTPFKDQFGCPSWTREIARSVPRLLGRGGAGLYHWAHDDWASWFEVFEFVKAHWKLPVRLVPSETARLHLPAKRPAFSVLSNRKLAAALGVQGLGSWKAPLAEFLDRVAFPREVS